ncbi:indole-3-glycerol-phosphate synthase [Candidatus Micrarchaeota archaeon]|nr:indole-3-glycerol-phosphate synthase [Candidatus Micrarchaeota archaeon]
MEHDILDKFIENAKASVGEGYYDLSDAEVQSIKVKIIPASLKRLLEAKFTLITEIKHASPAGEYSFTHIDVAATALAFKENGADAISVVVEPKIFHGNLKNITTAKQIAGLPVLFKDFVISEKQIIAAKAYGADVVLLIVKVATRLNLDLIHLISVAHSHGLEVLLECYDEDEMKIALATKADILGINNRDLRTLKVDLNSTENILNKVRANGLVIDRPIISESGIVSRADAEFVKKSGVNGILVGTAIWKAKNLREKVAELKIDS